MGVWINTLTSLLAVTTSVDAFRLSLGGSRVTPGQWAASRQEAAALSKRDEPLTELYPTRTLSIPVDHFHNESCYAPHSDATFKNRYWFDASHYKPGGPVIVLQSGETDATGRLPFLQKGILYQLAKATNGIGVVLEHRYYGDSFPTSDLSTENLRFLTTEQAMADQVYFAQNIKFPGLEHVDLTSKSTPYIGYGGSYPGAFTAILRVKYPDVFWGGISSSGVTKAIYDYWAYYKPIAEHAPPECVNSTQILTHVFDNIVIGKKSNKALTQQIKDVFGLGHITHIQDVAAVLEGGISNWQELNWDPAVSSPEVFNYCANVSSTKVEYPQTEKLRKTVSSLIQQGGYKPETGLVNKMLNYIGYVNLTAVAPCAASGQTQDECYSSYNTTFYQEDSIALGNWRSWPYQYCQQWGFLQTGSGVPADELPLVSRTLDLEYESIVCREAFNINRPADVESVNKYGGYNIAYPRLAIIDGDRDPWREATPHAFDFGARRRQSTTDQPFILIENAVHHYDENGLFPNETTASLPPPPVKDTQAQEAEFVKAWVAQWKREHKAPGYEL